MGQNALNTNLLACVLVACASVANAGNATIELAGIESWGVDGDPMNEVAVFDVPFNGFGVILGISYDITVETSGSAWLSDVNLRFGNSTGTFHGSWPDTIEFGGPPVAGTQRYTGSFFTDIHLNPDSEFHISLFQSFDANSNALDAVLLPGSTMSFSYFIPSPSSAGVLAMGGVCFARRRRV